MEIYVELCWKPLIDNGDKYKEYKKTTYDCYIYRTNQGALEMYVQLLNDGVKPYLNVDEIKQFFLTITDVELKFR